MAATVDENYDIYQRILNGKQNGEIPDNVIPPHPTDPPPPQPPPQEAPPQPTKKSNAKPKTKKQAATKKKDVPRKAVEKEDEKQPKAVEKKKPKANNNNEKKKKPKKSKNDDSATRGSTKVITVREAEQEQEQPTKDKNTTQEENNSSISPTIPVIALVNSSTQTQDSSLGSPQKSQPKPIKLINKTIATQTVSSKKSFCSTQTTPVKELKSTTPVAMATTMKSVKHVSLQTENVSKTYKTVSTDTLGLPSSSNSPQMSSKIIRVETGNKFLRRSEKSNLQQMLNGNEGIIPPTPEGPRFSQDGTQLTYTHPGVQAEFIQKIHTYHTQGYLADIIMRVEGIDFKAHKIVLAASSPYFAELFRTVNTVRLDRLILEGLKAQSVAAMIGYFYLAKLIIDVEDVEDLLDSAYYFKTMEVVKLCTDYLELQLGIYNCFNFYKIALKHDIENLRLKSFRYICWNFKSVVRGEEFTQLEGEILIQVVASKQVKVKAEEEVYEAVWAWYCYNKEERGFYIPKVVVHIHFELMELDYLEKRVKEELYLESELCRKKVNDAIQVVKNKIDVESRRLERYRQASDNVYLFVSNTQSCKLLDLLNSKYAACPELDLPMPMIDSDHHYSVKAGKNLYTLSKSKVSMFNTGNLNWEYFSTGISIYEAGICTTKNSIFVIGGKTDGKQLQELNLVTRQWTKLPDMEFDRRFPAVGTMGNTKPRVFAAGGFSPSKSCVLDSMEYYVAADKSWKCIKGQLSVPRMKASILVSGDRVYVVGGRSAEQSHASMDIFDRTAQKWTNNAADLSEPKENSSLVSFEGKIYCIGGDEMTSIEVLEEGNEEKDRKWKTVGNLKRLIRNFQCIVYTPL